jgi:S1-C subfamily serine protease
MKRSITAAATVITAIAAIVLMSGASAALAQPATQPATRPARGGPFLGARLASMNQEIAAELGIDNTDGVFVGEVIANTPAEAAGMQDHDIIKKMNDTDIKQLADLQKVLRSSKPGDVMTIVVLRGGQTQELKVTLGTAPATMPS